MQHAPDVDVIGMLDVEHEVRVVRQGPGAQTRQVQVMCVASRSRRGMSPDVAVRLLERVDEAERGGFRAFVEVVRDRVVDVLQ